jgi:hypothetical protein
MTSLSRQTANSPILVPRVSSASPVARLGGPGRGAKFLVKGAIPLVSANGSTGGIVWVLDITEWQTPFSDFGLLPN